VTAYIRRCNRHGQWHELDREGRLLICEQGTRRRPARITRIDLETKRSETVVEGWSGLPQLAQRPRRRSDRTIWFTDPSYGSLQGFRGAPQVGDFVYRHDPADGSTTVVADSFNKPNGLAFSPGESILYINDSAAIQGPGTYVVTLPHHIRAFDVHVGRLRAGRLIAVVSPGIPDGLKLDSAGRIYSSSATGVQVFTPDGELIGEILAPWVANFCFGGPENDTIFAMCDTSIVMARIAATGAIAPPRLTRGARRRRKGRQAIVFRLRIVMGFFAAAVCPAFTAAAQSTRADP
jgi:gluconolactonase